jgi:hypothetical protein
MIFFSVRSGILGQCGILITKVLGAMLAVFYGTKWGGATEVVWQCENGMMVCATSVAQLDVQLQSHLMYPNTFTWQLWRCSISCMCYWLWYNIYVSSIGQTRQAQARWHVATDYVFYLIALMP